MWRWLGVSALVVALDQLSKYWIEQTLLLFETRPVFPGFNLTRVYNEGAAFSMLSDAGGWQRGFFIVLAVAIISVLLVWLWRLPRGFRWETLAVALVIGGAFGNLIDRVRLGHVVDFLDCYVAEWHWPAFNVADAAISVGVVLLIVASLKSGKWET